jgi:uncharacterized damage-inducible protein DinB
MNTYCESALNQISVALTTTVEMIDQLEESDLLKRPTPDKYSIGELLEHIAKICKADLLIANGATQEEMSDFYSSLAYKDLHEIKAGIRTNFELLEETYRSYSEVELQQKVTSFWGISYSRYEWLLEVSAHVYHHRGQLHAMLVHCYQKDPHVLLFE